MFYFYNIVFLRYFANASFAGVEALSWSRQLELAPPSFTIFSAATFSIKACSCMAFTAARIILSSLSICMFIMISASLSIGLKYSSIAISSFHSNYKPCSS
eukprot:TRINITY_DN3941_c0_g1_i5.p2 TRINITY_DN3941_c0_g1~~TRINITY_DN3941_c0_g1_i5.p2  ORF type:complete len:101 (-),score=11.52 TRINITY_DN3941_c0_g1_i5:453-755(-)